MNTNKNDRNKEMHERYGHLLDKYINAGNHPNPVFHKGTGEYIKDVENGRYGHLLDKAKDPSQKTYNRMMKLYDMTLESRERRAREEEHAELAAKERIRNEKESERLHNGKRLIFLRRDNAIFFPHNSSQEMQTSCSIARSRHFTILWRRDNASKSCHR